MGKIRVNNVSLASIVITVVLAALGVMLLTQGHAYFNDLQEASSAYIECEEAASELQSAADYLVEESRLAVVTGELKHVENYFEERDALKRRENAIETFSSRLGDTDAVATLQTAMKRSQELVNTECHAMHLALEANNVPMEKWPEGLKEYETSSSDEALSPEEKKEVAQTLLFSDTFQSQRSEVSNNVSRCTEALTLKTKNAQGHAETVLGDIYRKIGVCFGIFAVITLLMSLLVRRSVVRPLLSYNKSIEKGEIFPVVGVFELQKLATTYNRVYRENNERQMLIRHQAEHDPLTDLFNRGAYDRMVKIYEEDGAKFALIILDVDTFKEVNDTFGHEMGDNILKEVAQTIKTTFRSIDYVFRIGGDEFAVIMVEMTSDLSYTVREKVEHMNKCLSSGENGLPPVTLSVGVAFTDREDAGESLFRDADRALYQTKQNGRNGCNIYGEF